MKDLNFKKCEFETDAKELADACNGERGETYFCTIILDCIDYFKHFDDVLVKLMYRSVNDMTHV